MTYDSRLYHIRAFAEQPDIRKKYPKAQDIDADHIALLATFLRHRKVSRNGHFSAEQKLMSERTRSEVLHRLKEALFWGVRNHMMPHDYGLPEIKQFIGRRMMKNPLREPSFALERRKRLVKIADAYQLITLSLQLVLPLRPEQVSGLLITDIDWTRRMLSFGTRFNGNDFTKGKTDFNVPFPEQLCPLLRRAVSNRVDGPVFLRRSVFEGQEKPNILISAIGDLEQAIHTALAEDSSKDLKAAGDAKDIDRKSVV